MPRKHEQEHNWPETAPRNLYRYRFQHSRTFYGPVKAHSPEHLRSRLRRWWQSVPDDVIIEEVKRAAA